MTLRHDISRCLGQHTSGNDCERMESCARYTERATRGPNTPVMWALCNEKNARFMFQIEVEAKRNG